MSDENKPNSAEPADEEIKKIVPVFLWTELYRLGPNSCIPSAAFKTQNRVLSELLPRRKEAYSLPEWYMEQKNTEDEDLLYVLCGVLHPAEGEMLFHYVGHWQKELIDEKRKENSWSEDEDDGPKRIIVPRATIQNFLQDKGREEFMRKNHENLWRRLSVVNDYVTQLGNALYCEAVRQDGSEWVIAMDELVGQYEFPDNASWPPNETACWIWMNKMVAPSKGKLWHLNLEGTHAMLDDFNWFRINKGFADLRDYADLPVCQQRENDEVVISQAPWMRAKIVATISFLLKNGFLIEKDFKTVLAMSQDQREIQEKLMKRNVVAAFVADICKSAPDNETLKNLLIGFRRYFQPILKQTGFPALSEMLVPSVNKKGDIRVDKLNGLIRVMFYGITEQRSQETGGSPQKKPDPPKTKPTNRPDSEASR